MQRELIKALWKHRKVVAKSGHGVGKTHTAANAAIAFLCSFEPSIVITTAPTWRQVESILWAEINKLHKKARIIPGGDLWNTSLKIDSDWFAIGLSTDDPDRFQGFHSPNILVIFDEAPGIDELIAEACEGLLTSANVHWLKIGNPTSPTGHFYNSFKNENWVKFTISCLDSPNVKIYGDFPPTEEGILALKAAMESKPQPPSIPSLVTAEWIIDRYVEWGFDHPLFKSRVLGEFPEEGTDTLIPLSLVEKSLTLEFKDEDFKHSRTVMGVDVARYGSDSTVFTILFGNSTKAKTKTIEWHHGKSLMETAGMVRNLCKEYGVNTVVIDDIGLGGGVTDALNETSTTNTFNVVPVNVGLPANNPDEFMNLKAEIWWEVREAFRKSEIAIIDKGSLLSQLPTLKYTYTSRGQLAIVGKDQMKKQGMKSPDFADSLALAYYGLRRSTSSNLYNGDPQSIRAVGVMGNIRTKVF